MITNDMLLTEKKWVLTNTTFDNTVIERIARVEVKPMRGLDDNPESKDITAIKLT